MAPVRLRFDRGTLLLGAPEDSPVRALAALTWDPRVRGFRAPAHRYTELRAALAAHGISTRDEVPPTSALSCRWQPFELRS